MQSFHLFETQVTKDVWTARHVQEWYHTIRESGHILEEIKDVEWVKRIGKFPLFVAMHVAVRPSQENRVKDNETVIIRPSTSHVLVWSESPHRVLLIKEYRTTVMNTKGFVYELPGGSSFKPDADPFEMAREELKEETGLDIAAERAQIIGIAQSAPTMIANRSFLVGIKLTKNEMDLVAQKNGEVHGNEKEGEKTYVRVTPLDEIMDADNDHFGWDLRGMIITGIKKME